MSNTHHYPHYIQKLWEDLPRLRTKKSPLIAGILGFLFGGIGIGLYFQSWKDAAYLIVIFIMLSLLLSPLVIVGPFLALCFASGWGVVRASGSG